MTENTILWLVAILLVAALLGAVCWRLRRALTKAEGIVALLCQDMAEWGTWEDGIPEEMWTDYRAGMDVVGVHGVRTKATAERLHAERQRLSDIACMEAIAAQSIPREGPQVADETQTFGNYDDARAAAIRSAFETGGMFTGNVNEDGTATVRRVK